ncbi:MAG: TolC family protein [Phycisphaerae bacterium]|nr:TolC family protein [Phycisphaerae bacterium]
MPNRNGTHGGWGTRVGAAFLLIGLPGCSGGLEDIDAKTDQLVREKSLLLGGATAARARDSARAAGDESDEDRIRAKSLPTRNPAASALAYTPADEARDVESRLSAYAEDGVPTGENGRPFSVLDAFRQSQLTAREYLNAEEEYILAAIRLLIEQHRWSPRLFAESRANFTAPGTDGRFDSAVRVINELRATQRLPYGGELEARWVWDATEQLRNQVSGQYDQASNLALTARVPLLRGAGLVAQEDLIQSERNLIYAARRFEEFRRTFLVSVARDYVNLLLQRARIENQKVQLEGLLEDERRTQALVQAGRLAEFQKNIASNRVLTAKAALANLRESHLLALDRFKVRLGLGVADRPALAPIELVLPDPDISPEAATELALQYRLDLQNRRDQVDDSRRAMRNATNGLLPDLDLTGGVTARTKRSAREGGFVYEPDDFLYEAGVTFGLPLDREIERLQVKQAAVNMERARRDLDLARDNVVLEVRSRVREIDRARFNLRLQEEAVRINLRRQEEQRIKRDELTTQQLIETANDLLAARDARAQAQADLRNAILDYLQSTATMRVAPDGTLEPLPGMEPRPAPQPGDATPDAPADGATPRTGAPQLPADPR